MAQLVGAPYCEQRGPGFGSGQGACLGCGFCPGQGQVRKKGNG